LNIFHEELFTKLSKITDQIIPSRFHIAAQSHAASLFEKFLMINYSNNRVFREQRPCNHSKHLLDYCSHSYLVHFNIFCNFLSRKRIGGSLEFLKIFIIIHLDSHGLRQ